MIADNVIINCLHTNYGINIAMLTLLPLGADIDASVYKAQAHDQTTYFVKLKHTTQADTSVIILQFLQTMGIQHIIPPIKTIDGQPTQQIENCTLIVYPFIAGQNGFERNLTNKQWITFGKTLRHIHDIDVPSTIQKHIRRETYSPKWRDSVRSLYAHIDAEPTGDEVALKLLTFMKQHIVAIRRLVDRAEQLAAIIRNTSTKFVLCHSDIHAGNVLLDTNDTIYLVDWDNPIMAPKERDLMFIGGGIANVWNQPNEATLFYQGYGETDINMTILAYYRHERIVEDIAIYGEEILLKESGIAEKQEMYQHFINMFEPNGVVDIAFKTDDTLAL